MTATRLLEELEALTHRERMRRMVRVGRDARGGDAAAKAVLDELGRAPCAYERSLALQAVYGSGDGAVVAARITDPSRTVRFRAMRLVAVACDDALAADALRRTESRRARTRLLALLHRRGRRGAIAAFLEAPSVLSDPRSFDLLPLATTELVTRELAAFRQHASGVGWARLAKHQPALAAAEFERLAAARLDPRSRGQVLPNLVLVARGDPDGALAVVARLVEAGEPVPVAAANELVKRRPREIFDLLRRRDEHGAPARPPGPFAGVRLARAARRLGPDRLAYAIRRAHPTLPDGKRARRWFLSLTEGDRRAVLDAWASASGIGAWGAFLLRHLPRDAARARAFERWVAAARDRHGVVGVARLADLPHDLRHAEAERHLVAVPHLEGKPERLAWAALLPLARAKEHLASFLGHPEGDLRAVAMRTLVGCVDGDRANVEACLEIVRARRFEQDPVRLAFMQALSELPWACFPPSSLPAVAEIVEGALAASDLSSTTAMFTERLVARLFRVDPEWGAAWLARVVEVRGSVSQGGLGEGLLPDDLVRFEPAFARLVSAWATTERAGAILWLARSLGNRLALAPSLLAALERLATELPFVGVAAAALALLRRASPERFARLVPPLLDADPSSVLLPIVALHVSCDRQDLLPGLLSQEARRGRFATGRTHWVVDWGRGFATWTARTQQRYAAALAALVEDPARDVPTLRFALDRLAELAFADSSALLRFTGDPRQPVREIAIDAAARLDAGQGVDTLVACLEDDRARWAIYALRACFAEMPRAEVLAKLRAVPRDKVTVAKEVVRLLGELGGDEAFGELLAFELPGTKRDVRIAMLRALWDHLHRTETWAVFERAAADPDWVVASRIADVPMLRLTDDAEARFAELLARVLDRPEAELRLDLLRRAGWLPLRDRERRLFSALTRRISAETAAEAKAATQAVIQRMHADEIQVVLDAIEPVIRRRDTLCDVLEALRPRSYGPAHARRLAEIVLARIGTDPLSTAVRVDFAGHVLDPDGFAAVLREVHEADRLHVDAMSAAFGGIERCVAPARVEQLLLERAGDAPALRRLALHALVAQARDKGWTSDRRARLETYRADPALVVAAAAAYVFPPPLRVEVTSPSPSRSTAT